LQASIAAAKLQATKDEQDMLKAIKDAMIHHTPMTPGAASQMEGEAGLLSNPPKTSTEMEAAVKDAEKRAEAFSKNPPADFQSYLRLTNLVGRMLALQDKLTEATGQPDTKLNDLETKLAEIESRLEIKFLDILKYTTTWGSK
jgi:hypothetical protein